MERERERQRERKSERETESNWGTKCRHLADHNFAHDKSNWNRLQRPKKRAKSSMQNKTRTRNACGKSRREREEEEGEV